MYEGQLLMTPYMLLEVELLESQTFVIRLSR
jgi:hypothetical protein